MPFSPALDRFAPWIFVVFMTGCSSLMYQPSRETHIEPSRLGLPTPEEVWIESSEPGTFVHGWYFHNTAQPERPKTVGLLFHGNAENISTHFLALAWILGHGHDYLIVDYQGYGISQGTPTPQNTVQDARLWMNYLRARIGERAPWFVLGQSLGGAVALRAVADTPQQQRPQLLVVDSTFPSYQRVGRRLLAKRWWTWWLQPLAWLALSDHWAPEGHIAQIAPTRLVVIHGDHDAIIDFDQGEALFSEAAEPKDFWKHSGGRHIECFMNLEAHCRKQLIHQLNDLEEQFRQSQPLRATAWRTAP